METIKIDCYEVVEVINSVTRHIAYVDCNTLANSLATEGNASFRKINKINKTYHICHSLSDTDLVSELYIKEQALLKLTEQEIEVLCKLGIK